MYYIPRALSSYTDAYANPTYSPTIFSNHTPSFQESYNSLRRMPFHPVDEAQPAYSEVNQKNGEEIERETQPTSPPARPVVNNTTPPSPTPRPAEESEKEVRPISPHVYSAVNKKKEAPRLADERPKSPPTYSMVNKKRGPAEDTGKEDQPISSHVYSVVNKRKRAQTHPLPPRPRAYSAVNKNKRVEAQPTSTHVYSEVNKKAPHSMEENERLYHVLEGVGEGGGRGRRVEGDSEEDERQNHVFGEQRGEEMEEVPIYEEAVFNGPEP